MNKLSIKSYEVNKYFIAGPTMFGKNFSMSNHYIDYLTSQGIDIIICLQDSIEINLETVQQINNRKIDFEHFPIKDYGVPTKELMLQILDAIDSAISADQKVYLHCYGGIGRTGTVVGCYLMRHQLANKTNVLDKIRVLQKSNPLNPNPHHSPETEVQREFIFNF